MKRSRFAWGAVGPFVLGRPFVLGSVCLGTLGAVACGERDSKWSEPVGEVESYGLSGSVALVDRSLDRLLMVRSPEPDRIDVKSVTLGQNVTAVERSADQTRLFVLSSGSLDETNPDAEHPQLMVVDGAAEVEEGEEAEPFVFDLDDPLRKLAVDPLGEWVVAYEAAAVLTNPNELVICSLGERDDRRATPKTIRSFGGSPEELIFTSALTVPQGGARRFLVARTDRDVALIDLAHLNREEVTVRLPETSDGTSATPAQIVYSDGDPDDDTDARLAVRLANSADVVLLELGPPSGDGDFTTTVNIVDVGGVPSTIEFVRTDGGLRLAALVPGRSQATLVDPRTTVTEVIPLPVSYSQMRLITEDAGSDDPNDEADGANDESDRALLYSPDQEGIAFWSLGQTSGSPFRSVDANDIDIAVSKVTDVPGDYRHLKLLSSEYSSRLYVLDLKERQTFPLNNSLSGLNTVIAPDGGRFWAYAEDYEAKDFASVELETLHPTSLAVRVNVSAVHDIQRASGGRAAIVLHGTDGKGYDTDPSLTLFDALDPDSARTRYFGGLFLEGL